MSLVDVLLVGSGGREHAMAWKIAQSPRLGKLYIAPGNGGTQDLGENVPIKATDIKNLLLFAVAKNIGLTIVGPDDPLMLGIVDSFQAYGVRIFGPTKAAAEIEWSKAFAKELMLENQIPTAKFGTFTNSTEALAYVYEHGVPIVIKASGLALGKGVYVCQTIDEAEDAIEALMVQRAHQGAGKTVVIEDYIEGPEISIHAFSDSKTVRLFPPAQDHKAALDGDKGKMTGGMGTITGVPWVTPAMKSYIRREILMPVITTMASKGRPFVGCLYPGLKIPSIGPPRVLEYNARLGDPETQCYMRLLQTDLLDVIDACIDGKLAEIDIHWSSGYAACVVMASEGYPDDCQKGRPIFGIKEANTMPDVVVFHAGTSFLDGKFITSGGRVLGVSATDSTLCGAIKKAYGALGYIYFDGMQYRSDIGTKTLAQLIA